ncbi:hypothetical protein BofuT4_uP145500.1 [Botrytis cinerea T4]|uniref:Uncharacterized protein n=1 Tax=Botryotinia fuckeliana (strain T4) TaxID=999810 RepID=G2YXN3_BOTF4|nr:hypothetical protein BofuT4_uP145500.1 [Botrytis cinerea T4]
MGWFDYMFVCLFACLLVDSPLGYGHTVHRRDTRKLFTSC